MIFYRFRFASPCLSVCVSSCASPQFPDVCELISGHKTLNSINEHLGLVTQQRKAVVKKAEAELAEVVQRGSESLLCKTNELAHLQGLLDKSDAEIMNLVEYHFVQITEFPQEQLKDYWPF